jgi:DNA-binding winged helix-turn-helix (wHTH) protein
MGLAQTASNSPDRYQDPHLEVDFIRKYAALDAHRLVLTRKEYELLALLVENAGEIIPRQILLMRVWGYSNEIRTRTLDVHVRRLRKKLGQYSEQYIETIFGIGYRFQPFRLTQRFPSGESASPMANPAATGVGPYRKRSGADCSKAASQCFAHQVGAMIAYVAQAHHHV